VAKEISLASSNAGVLAVRAGSDAAGFGALAEFLDQLARKTIQASHDINQQAMNISRLTTNAVRTQSALEKYDNVKQRAETADHVESLTATHAKIRTQVQTEADSTQQLTKKLSRHLEDLKQDLDVGRVLASMSLVEASQAGKDFSAQLSDNARNIASAIGRIDVHVSSALDLMKKALKKR
jgi:methyl-accepting chemotaxis protein